VALVVDGLLQQARALITLVNAEDERRSQLAKATIAAMQSP
jgi:hypothetical protein